MNNKVIADLYSLYYAFSDGFFPGLNGFELRTIHDPWGDGRNVVLIGSRNVEGARKGAEELIKSLKFREEGTVYVDKIIRVALGEDVKKIIPAEVMKPTERLIQRIEERAVEAMETEAHGNLAPYIALAGFLYYLSGSDKYAELFKRLIYLYESYYRGPITSTRRELGPWGFDADFYLYRMMPAWDLVEESPVFSEEDRLKITNVFVEFVRHVPPCTWLVYKKEGESSWRIREVYRVRQNHQTFAALGLTYAGTYFSKYYPDFKEAEFWLELADKVFYGQIGAFKPIENSNGYQWFTLYHTMRYSLVKGDRRYFESGNARKSADLAIICMDNLGYQVPFGDNEPFYGSLSDLPVLKCAAYYYRDGRYQWILLKRRKAFEDLFKTAGKADMVARLLRLPICEYEVDLEPREPVDLLGVIAFPLDREFFKVYEKETATPFEKTFDKIVMRESYDPERQYLLLDGLSCGSHAHPDGNSILRITDKGRIWLDDCSYRLGQMKHHNTLIILKDGEADIIPRFCELENIADLGDIGFSETSAKGYNGVDWYRNIIWVKEKYFAVVDELEAREENEYDFHLIWRTVGTPIKESNSLTVEQKGVKFTIMNLDGATLKFEDDFEAGENWRGYPYADPVVHVMRQVSKFKLKPRERRVLINLLYAFEGEEDKPVKNAVRVGENQILVQEKDEVACIGITPKGDVSRLRGDDGSVFLETDASIYYIASSKLALVNATHLSSNEFAFESSFPISININFNMERAIISANTSVEIVFRTSSPESGEDALINVRKHLDAGRHEISLKGLKQTPFTSKLRSILSKKILEKSLEVKRVEERFEENYGLTLLWRWRLKPGEKFTSISRGDLNGDGFEEILAGSSEGKLYVFSHDGVKMWERDFGSKVNSIGVSDVDGDGELEIAVGLQDSTIHLLDSKGIEIWGYRCRRHIGRLGSVSTVFAADINGDGREEIIAGAANWLYYAFKHDGSLLWSSEAVWPSTVGCAADIDGDGEMEVLAGTKLALTVFNSDGSRKWRFAGARKHYAPFGKGRVIDVCADDIDADGLMEIIYASADGNIYVLSSEGRVKWMRNAGEEPAKICIADVDADGSREIIVGSTSFSLFLFKGDGRRVWRMDLGDKVQAIALGDIDGDNFLEIIAGGGNVIYVLNADGEEKARYAMEASITQIIALDSDRDDKMEIAAISEDGSLSLLKFR
ncbi:MAG: hypothetical protein DRO14_04820 [Thermoprotei archaeon]|nr:MAG: hypothetical protein DRO14_04820 [Thermoprotei archaeon]